MDRPVFEELLQRQLITAEQFDRIQQQRNAPVSVHWELRTLLYLGISLLITALGILVYKNIDTIGHGVLIALIAIACAACFIYCFKTATGYDNQKVESPGTLFDYILLLGCLLLLTLTGYLQYAYNIFGSRWGLALFIPMVLLFCTAYYFDHLGVLSLAITNLAAWVGIASTPMQLLRNNSFGDAATIYAGIVLGAGLIATAFVSVQQSVKAHFSFTYKNFGAHILFIALLAALFHFEAVYLLWFAGLTATGFLFFNYAVKERSFYFLVITVLYIWIGLSYVIMKLLFLSGGEMNAIYPAIIYFIASGVGLIKLLMHYNKKLKHDAQL